MKTPKICPVISNNCKDPFHNLDSISIQIYDKCPTCGYMLTFSNLPEHMTTAYIASDLEIENQKLTAALKCAKDALETILHRGNVAMQGHWDDTTEMKDASYEALKTIEELMK